MLLIGIGSIGLLLGLYFRKRSQKLVTYMCLLIAIGGLLGGAISFTEGDFSALTTVQRKKAGDGSSWLDLQATDSDGNLIFDESVEIKELELTGKDKEALMERAIAEFDNSWLGDNVSQDQVSGDLYLQNSYANGLVTASFDFDDYQFMGYDGHLENQDIPEAGVDGQLTITFTYQEFQQIEVRYFHLTQAAVTDEELLKQHLTKALVQAEESSRTNSEFQLPQEIDGVKVSWQESPENNGWILFGICLLGAVGLWFGQKEKEHKDQKLRLEHLTRQYPVMVNQFALLMSAGMTAVNAWELLVRTYKNSDKNQMASMREVYEEMSLTWGEMQKGVSWTQAFEGFGKRIGIIHYRRFAMLLIQNISKGKDSMGLQLKEEAMEMFEERKRMARKAGEEAGTKMLFPMMIMLVIVVVMMIVPAFSQT